MVQFLSIIFFFFDFFNFCWGFQKFPFFCVTLYLHHIMPCQATCAVAYITSLIQPLHTRTKGSTLGKCGRNFRFSSV